MDFYAHVCKNGHVLLSRHLIEEKECCEKCGAEMIDKCPSCQSAIREWHLPASRLDPPKYERASYCRKCGEPYPWTKAAIKATSALIAEEAELSDLEQEKLIASLPDIIADTPKTSLAVVRFKKAAISAGKFTADALRQFAIDFGCELAKKQLGL